MPYWYKKEDGQQHRATTVQQREPDRVMTAVQRGTRREPLSTMPQRQIRQEQVLPGTQRRVRSTSFPSTSRRNVRPTPVPSAVGRNVRRTPATSKVRRGVQRQILPFDRARLQMMLGAGLILCTLLIIGVRVFASNSLPTLQMWQASQFAQANQNQPLSSIAHFPVQRTTTSVTAFAQADKKQYNNENPEWAQWSYSACSGCALAALMDAYGASIHGRPLNCGDVLEVEKRISVYSPVNEWGLINGSPDEVAQTATQFGFTAHYTQKLSLDDLITLANAGVPSVIRIPTHIMLLTGGDSGHVFLADSGGLHLSQVTRDQFLYGLPGSRLYAGQSWMNGWYVILTPNGSAN